MPQHGRQRQVVAPSDADIEQRLNDLVKPAVFAELFERVLAGVLAQLPARSAARTRPVAPRLSGVQTRMCHSSGR